MKKCWNSIDILPKWVGFAWFGWLKMVSLKTVKAIEVSAGGTYRKGGRSMQFKIENWDKNKNIDDYKITHYITRPDKIPNLFNTNNTLFKELANK